MLGGKTQGSLISIASRFELPRLVKRDPQKVVRVRVFRVFPDDVAELEHRFTEALLVQKLGGLLDGLPMRMIRRRGFFELDRHVRTAAPRVPRVPHVTEVVGTPSECRRGCAWAAPSSYPRTPRSSSPWP